MFNVVGREVDISGMSGRRNGQSGFTLLELLVVKVIMGVVSGGAIVGVTAVRRSAQDAACTADADALETAEQASFATTGSYLDEQGLVDAGYLREPSDHFDVTATQLGYELVPVGDCTVPGPEMAAGEPADDDAAAAADAAPPEETVPEAAPPEAVTPEAVTPDGAAPDPPAPDPAAPVPGADPPVAVDGAAADAKPVEPSPTTAPAAAGCGKGQIDINSAEKKQLRAISGVGGDEATRIVKQRPFESLGQLSEVKGLSAAQVEKIIDEGVACIG